jgi:hypothetical protein
MFRFTATLLLCVTGIAAAASFQLTGNYFVYAIAGPSGPFQNLGCQNCINLSGATSYALPDMKLNLSGTAATAEAELFGDASLDIIHSFEDADASGPFAAARVILHLDGSDTITPQSSTVPVGTPVTFSLGWWAEGQFVPTGICPASAGLEMSMTVSGAFIDINGCPGGPFVSTGPAQCSNGLCQAYGTVSGFVGQPLSFSWSYTADINPGIPASGGTSGITLEGLDTQAFTIQSLTPGVTFSSASGATYDAIPTPEPGTAILMAVGTLLLTVRYWRR